MEGYDVAIEDAQSWGSVHVARWAGLLGIVIPAIGLVIYPIWSFPGTQKSGAQIALWAAVHHDRLIMTMLLYTVGVTLWLAFGAAIWTYLHGHLPAGSTLPSCFGAGLIGYVTLLLSGFTAFDLLLYRQHSAELSAFLYDLTFGLLAMSGNAHRRGTGVVRRCGVSPPDAATVHRPPSSSHRCCTRLTPCSVHRARWPAVARRFLDYRNPGLAVGLDPCNRTRDATRGPVIKEADDAPTAS